MIINLIKYIFCIFLLVIGLQIVSCKRITTEPSDSSNFSVKIILKNSSQMAIPGIEISGGNILRTGSDLSSAPIAVAIYKLRLKAKHPDSNSMLYEDSIHMVRSETYSILGYTSTQGIYICNNPNRFPNYFNPQDYSNRGENNEELGTFTISDSARFVLKDTATNEYQVFYCEIKKGHNEFYFIWDQTKLMKSYNEFPLTQNQISFQNTIDSNYYRITIRDSHQPRQRSQNLYLVREDKGSRSELPPPAPEFDVRFTSNMFIETYPVVIDPNNPSRYMISIQATDYPLTVNWQFKCPPNFTLTTLLYGKEINRRLICDSSEFIIVSPDITRLVISVHEPSVPALWKLHQNYPNPFSGQTTICYDNPEKAIISLKVYDMGGKELTMLVNEEKPAGAYKTIY